MPKRPWSLDDLNWAQTKAEVEGTAVRGGSIDFFEEKRKTMRAQLSANFPPSTIEHVMRRYPHVQDTAQLMTLIQKHKTSF